MNYARILSTWFLMLLVAVANGTLRDFTYGRMMDELTAHWLSTAIAMVLLGAVMRFHVRRWPPSSARNALVTGLSWLALTVAFEFLFFHYAGGHSWAELLDNYDLLRGRVWVVLLLWIAVAPWWFHRRGRVA